MSTAQDNNPEKKLSKAEQIKEDSHGLLGRIAEELTETSPAFSGESVTLLKHHGTYQQDDRDTRSERKKQGLDRDYRMMIRTKFPGGYLTAEQWLICDELATKYGQDDLRVTSRQGFQFHGVVKGALYPLMHELNRLAEITTWGACGDVVRNTMACPVSDIEPRFVEAGIDLYGLAKEISNHFLPSTPSYYDLWVEDKKASLNSDGTVTFHEQPRAMEEADPIYGHRYLPRKFKIGLAADFDNSIDVYTQDVGIMAVTRQGALEGYEILVGGGLGYTHRKPATYARLGTPLAFVQRDEIVPLLEAIVKVQRDHGDREDRRHARLKYLVDDRGIDGLRELVFRYAGREFDPPRGIEPTAQPDYLGWHRQAQEGLNYVGVWVANGRVRDFPGSFQFKSGLRLIAERFEPSFRLTPHHNVIIANIRDEDVEELEGILNSHDIPTATGVSALRRREMACPALPLCGLALAEAERAVDDVITAVEEAGHADADVVIRMSGCPNNCPRPKTAELGIVGAAVDKYHVHVGGDYLGRRLCEPLRDNVRTKELPTLISQLLDWWKAEAHKGERFGDWANRLGAETLRQRVEEAFPTS
ncbi:MAG: NADPH-dependent assimilatory sulfite reductase hemoprotein subunit [Candidatus Hydrogenedentota bacterium]